MFLVLAAALTLATRPAAAADEAAPPREVIFAKVTLGGIDRTDAALKRGGFNEFNKLFDQVMAAFPTVPQDAFDRTAPVGMFFAASDATPTSSFFALPLKRGTLPLKTFIQQNDAKPLPGHADTVATDLSAFRRTERYFIFGNTPTLVEPTDASLMEPARDPGVLLHLDLDLRAVRASAPKKLNAFLDQVGKEGPNADLPGVEMGRRSVTEPFRKALDSFKVTLSADESTATLRAAAQPIALAAPSGKFAKPVFPKECFAQLHYSYPAREARPAVRSALMSFWQAGMGGRSQTKAKRDEASALSEAAVDLLIGDAVSAAGEMTDSGLVVYVVIQTDEPRDLEATLDRFQASFRKSGNLAAGEMPWKRSTYQHNEATTVHRLAISDPGKPVIAYADLVARDKALFIAVSMADGKHLGKLLDLKSQGQIDQILTVDGDLPAIGKLLAALPKGQIPDDAAAVLTKLCKAGKVRLALNGDGKSATLEVQTPLTFLAEAVQALSK